MTPFEYVKNYAFPSPARLVLYNHVFNLYKEEPEDEEQTERILLGKVNAFFKPSRNINSNKKFVKI